MTTVAGTRPAGLACLRWLLALLASTDRAGDIVIGASTDEGTTVLRPAALIEALTSEVSADRQALHQRIEAEAFAHTRQAMDDLSLPIQLDLA